MESGLHSRVSSSAVGWCGISLGIRRRGVKEAEATTPKLLSYVALQSRRGRLKPAKPLACTSSAAFPVMFHTWVKHECETGRGKDVAPLTASFNSDLLAAA